VRDSGWVVSGRGVVIASGEAVKAKVRGASKGEEEETLGESWEFDAANTETSELGWSLRGDDESIVPYPESAPGLLLLSADVGIGGLSRVSI
jgi:hypothetical protein